MEKYLIHRKAKYNAHNKVNQTAQRLRPINKAAISVQFNKHTTANMNSIITVIVPNQAEINDTEI